MNSGTDEVGNNSGFLAHDDVTPSILNIACTKKKCLSFLPHQLWHTMLLHGCDIVTLLKKTTNKKKQQFSANLNQYEFESREEQFRSCLNSILAYYKRSVSRRDELETQSERMKNT